MIENSTVPGETVLDCFAGSASTDRILAIIVSIARRLVSSAGGLIQNGILNCMLATSIASSVPNGIERDDQDIASTISISVMAVQSNALSLVCNF